MRNRNTLQEKLVLANEVMAEGKLPCAGVNLLLAWGVCTSSWHTDSHGCLFFLLLYKRNWFIYFSSNLYIIYFISIKNHRYFLLLFLLLLELLHFFSKDMLEFTWGNSVIKPCKKTPICKYIVIKNINFTLFFPGTCMVTKTCQNGSWQARINTTTNLWKSIRYVSHFVFENCLFFFILEYIYQAFMISGIKPI